MARDVSAAKGFDDEQYAARDGEKTFGASIHGDVPPPQVSTTETLSRRLSARQVQMIAIGGTIGTGLFLGTGNSLAKGMLRRSRRNLHGTRGADMYVQVVRRLC